MKKILWIGMFLIIGFYCFTFRNVLENHYTDILLEQEKKLEENVRQLKDIEMVNKLKEPENQPRPFVTRTYGSSEDNAPKVKIVEPSDCIMVQELFALMGLGKTMIVPDVYYWLPSREFVTKKLLPLYKKYKEEKHFTYGPKFDCDDFSRNFSIFAQSVYTDLVINKNIEAICAGELYYVPDPETVFYIGGKFIFNVKTIPAGENHAINIIILDDMSVMFIEPQTGEEVTLSPTEKHNIIFCKF